MLGFAYALSNELKLDSPRIKYGVNFQVGNDKLNIPGLRLASFKQNRV